MKSFVIYVSLFGSLGIFLETSHAFDAAIFFVLFGIIPVSHSVVPAAVMLGVYAVTFGVICTSTIYSLVSKQKPLLTFRRNQTA